MLVKLIGHVARQGPRQTDESALQRFAEIVMNFRGPIIVRLRIKCP